MVTWVKTGAFLKKKVLFQSSTQGTEEMLGMMNNSTSYLIEGVVHVIDDFKANFKTWGDEQRLEWDNIEATILEL